MHHKHIHIPTNVSNYRSITNLPFLGKLLESIEPKQIQRNFFSIITIDQHGFVSGRSTATSLVDLVSSLQTAF